VYSTGAAFFAECYHSCNNPVPSAALIWFFYLFGPFLRISPPINSKQADRGSEDFEKAPKNLRAYIRSVLK
jgi:hypothetical protein